MSLQWVPKSNGEYIVSVSGGVHAGVDSGDELYVARAYHDGAIVPGKLQVSHSSVYIPYNMSEVSKTFLLSDLNSITLPSIRYRFPYKVMRFKVQILREIDYFLLANLRFLSHRSVA